MTWLVDDSAAPGSLCGWLRARTALTCADVPVANSQTLGPGAAAGCSKHRC